MDTCITAWYRILQEEKATKAAEAVLAAEHAKMSEWQKKKKEDAKKVFARVAAQNDMGLLDTCLTGWFRFIEQSKLEGTHEKAKKAQAAADELTNKMKQKIDEYR